MNIFEKLPAINDILQQSSVQALIDQFGEASVKKQARAVVANLRQKILRDAQTDVSMNQVVSTIKQLLKAADASLRPVVNGTGIIIHTNLGRSVLSHEIQTEFNQIAFSYSNLEYNLQEGKRGIRYAHVEGLLSELTGAQAALVVNNNAAAMMLILDTFSKNKNVIISRGELVEIGGSFRIPEVITSVGGQLKEVGTTNKTHPSDYDRAVDEETAAILKVHTSNYKIIGFTQSVPEADLAQIARQHHLPLITDLGSGLLVDLKAFGVTDEPTVQETVAHSDIVAFSGDKLLGGPQAGIIVGKKALIDQLKHNQMLRALRVDKLTLSALEATLKIYQKDKDLLTKIPTLRMITTSLTVLKQRANQLADKLKPISQLQVSVSSDFSKIGGGSFPGFELPTYVVQLKTKNLNATQFESALRTGMNPIITRIHEDVIQIDVRTLLPQDSGIIIDSIQSIMAGKSGPSAN